VRHGSTSPLKLWYVHSYFLYPCKRLEPGLKLADAFSLGAVWPAIVGCGPDLAIAHTGFSFRQRMITGIIRHPWGYPMPAGFCQRLRLLFLQHPYAYWIHQGETLRSRSRRFPHTGIFLLIGSSATLLRLISDLLLQLCYLFSTSIGIVFRDLIDD
jgi:hypothetical protein